MNDDDPWLITFWVLAGISMIDMIFVSTHIFQYGNFKELRTQLLSILYVTVLIEEISYLPATYNSILGLCRFMGWLHYYSGFINVLTIFMMSCHYFSFICAEKYQEQINKAISKYGFLFAFCFPLITLLPYSTNSYNTNREIWCTLSADNEVSKDWAYIIFYCWIIFFLILGNIQFFYSLHILSQLDIGMRTRLFYSSGVFIMISTYAWIPRILMRIFNFKVQGSHNIANLITTGQLYVSGLMYGLVYAYTQPTKYFVNKSVASGMGMDMSVINLDELKEDLIYNTPLHSIDKGPFDAPNFKLDGTDSAGNNSRQSNAITEVGRDSESSFA